MFLIFDHCAERPLCCLTATLNDRFTVRLIYTSVNFLLNLCKGVARSKVFFILLLADALFIPTCRDEIYGILAEDTILDTISVCQRNARSFVCQS